MSQRTATGATFAGIAHRFRRRARIGALGDTDRITAKSCLVTGANVGLGRAVTTDLARRGGDVLMAGRTLDEVARADICATAGSSNVTQEYLDLADLATVLAFVDGVRASGRDFDIVVLNAGIVPRSARATVDGLEEGFQVNFFASFLLVNELLDAGAIGRGARIVFVSSESHRSAEAIDWAELGSFRDYGLSGAVREYGRTKLLTCTHAAELARRLWPCGIAVHALCPGAVNTRLAREAPVWSRPLLKIAFTLFFRTPEAAAEPANYLCCAPTLEERTGVYLHVMEEKPMAALATSPEQGAALFGASEALVARLSPAARSRA